MSDARNVYIILFVMLLLPIVFYMLRRRYRTHDTKKKMRYLVYMVVMIIAAGGACFGLYSHTIHTEPLLVAEQTADRAKKSLTLVLAYCNCPERAASLRAAFLSKCEALREVLMVPTGGLSTVYANNGGVVVAF